MKKLILCLVALFMFMGCGKLLPRTNEVVVSPYDSYQEVNGNYGNIKEGLTTDADLIRMKMHPSFPNIGILNYLSVRDIFMPPGSNIRKEDLDKGVQDFLNATEADQVGYEINPEKMTNKRTLDNDWEFWLDFFDCKRKYTKKGWKFKGLILLVDGLVVYKLDSEGSPFINKIKEVIKPLCFTQNVRNIILQNATKSFLP